MFLIGDKVVHPMHGAGVIERITHERLGSCVSSYYVFHMPSGGLVLKIPTDACCQIGLRCCPQRSISARCSPPFQTWRSRCPPIGTSATGTIWPG